MTPAKPKRDWNPAATIIAVIIIQLGLALWWGGEINHRVSALESNGVANARIAQEVIGMKRDVAWIKSTLERMEARR